MLFRSLNMLSQTGIVEAIQSKYSIAELIEELHNQIDENCNNKVLLIGHSWGAWLAALFAEKYPELIERIILVGSAPLEEKYVSEIRARRLENLSEEDGAIFQRLIDNRATDEDMKKVPQIFEKSDNYCLETANLHRADKTDSQMHNVVWEEAAKLRTQGKLLTSFKQIKCKIVLIQEIGRASCRERV